jgi:hypothetical protein
MRRLRERRAAGLQAADGAPLRDASELLGPAVEASIAALELAERDAAAAMLARQYATVIDRAQDTAWALRYIGPLLLKSLESLQATPSTRRARPAKPAGPNRVQQLRAAHVLATRRQGG